MKKTKYSINHDIWSFSVLNEKEYITKHGKNSVAMTTFDTLEVDFKINELNMRTLIHELTHVHYHYCFTDSTNHVSLADQEEIFCELFAYRLELIRTQSKEIYKKLKK